MFACLSMSCFFSNRQTQQQVGGACDFRYFNILHLAHCIFTKNSAEHGGALHVERIVDGHLSNCVFLNNTADYGGAVSVHHVVRNTNVFAMWNCSFHGNKAKIYGGAVQSNKTSLNVSSSEFSNNLSGIGTALVFSGMMSTLHVLSSQICNNTSVKRFFNVFGGSAVFVSSASHVFVSNVNFLKNHDGGGIKLLQGPAEIHNCLFEGNYGQFGGAVSTGLGQLIVYNTSFIDNRAHSAVIMSSACRNTVLQNCYFENNRDSTHNSGFLFRAKGTVRLYNNMFVASTNKYDLQTTSLFVFDFHVETATLYSWQMFLRINSNKVFPVDRKFVYTGENTNLTLVESIFASGWWNNCWQILNVFLADDQSRGRCDHMFILLFQFFPCPVFMDVFVSILLMMR